MIKQNISLLKYWLNILIFKTVSDVASYFNNVISFSTNEAKQY